MLTKNRLTCGEVRFALLVACGGLGTGCIAFPTPGRITGYADQPTPDIRKMVGDAESNRPIRPGVTRETVLEKLGPPYYSRERGYAKDNGRREMYRYETHGWWGFCFVPLGHFWGDISPLDSEYALDIAYDDQDRIKSVSLQEMKDGFPQLEPATKPATPPD